MPGLSEMISPPERADVVSRGGSVFTHLPDSNIVFELRTIGDGKADANVVAWAGPEESTSFFFSAISILELEHGILGGQQRDARQSARLRTWLDNHIRP